MTKQYLFTPLKQLTRTKVENDLSLQAIVIIFEIDYVYYIL